VSPTRHPQPAADRLTALVATLTPQLRDHVRRFAVGPQDCDDILQDVWMLYLLHRHRITDQERTAAWLRTTASRRALRRRLDSGAERADQAAVEQALIDTAGPAHHATAAEQRRAVRRAVARLDRRDRLLAGIMATRPDLGYRAIAELLDVAIDSVGPLRRRCLNRLRVLLAAEGITDPAP
jgi:RNA polymerase sigma factor (sigma-70 family)